MKRLSPWTYSATDSPSITSSVTAAGSRNQNRKKDYRKPIVAVRRWRHKKVSPVLSLAADKLVDWSTESIVSAIREVEP